MKKQPAQHTQLALPFAEEMIAVHCFFNCGHVVRAVTPQDAHNLMEQHYTAQHAQQVNRIVRMLTSN